MCTHSWTTPGRTNQGRREWRGICKHQTDEKCVQGLCGAKFGGKGPL